MATQEMQRREDVANMQAPRPRRPRLSPHVRGEGIDVASLTADIRRSRFVLRYPRESVRQAVQQFVGQHYSEDGTTEEVPVNLLALYVSIVSRSLIAKNPRMMLSTFQKQNKPTVSAMQTWINSEIERMHLAKSLQRWVTDALFSIGIMKVALSTPSDAAHLSWNLRAGQPFAQTIHIDDFVCDMHARDFSEVSYIGHRYRVPLDTVRDSSIYSKERKTLTASYDPLYNEEGDERISVIGRTSYATGASGGEEYDDMVDLWEIYDPRRRLVITLASDNAGNPTNSEPLRVQRWIGPDCGPYHILGFGIVPGNLMPKAPIQDLYDLHMHANQLYRKLLRQAQRQKTLLLWSGAAEGDGTRIQNANDGDCPRVDNPDRVQLRAFDQVSQLNLAIFQDTIHQFNVMAGNLETLGGLSPQSKTATQDKMLNANASATMSSMQDTVVQGTSAVVKALCWYFKHDPFKVQKSIFQIPSMPEIQTVRAVTPQQRNQVPWDEMEIRIDPYSLQAQTPQMRKQLLTQNLIQLIIPLMGLLQQQGIQLDMNTVLRKVGQYDDDPDLQDILTIAEPPQQQTPGDGQKPPMPTQSERTYNRVSMPGRTNEGDRLNAMNALRGINPGGNPEETGGQ